MTPRPGLAALVAALAFSALAVDPRLMRPILGDPSRMFGFRQPAWHCVATFFMPGGHAAVTAVAWARVRAPSDEFGSQFKRCMMYGDCTVAPARATAEGGASLPDLLSGAYTGAAAVPLSSRGTWSAACLPSTWQAPGQISEEWRYGCYCINLRTDAALTLTVGGGEVTVPHATNMVRNVLATSADRTVTIAAASPSATVHFGLAVNPLVQFFGGVMYAEALDTQQLTSDYSVFTNEYAMMAFRARLLEDGAKVETALDAYTRSGWHHGVAITQRVDAASRAVFAPDARIRLHLCRLAGDTEALDGTDVWGVKQWRGWLPDALLDRVLHQDMEEMARRGMDPWWRE